MATAQDVSSAVTEIQLAANTVLSLISTLDPGVAVPAQLAEELLALAAKAIAAWSSASGVAITADSVLALMPNATPLTPPTE
jgi:hypothetical protein